MFGIEKDFQNLMEQVYGPLNEDKMTEKEQIQNQIQELQEKLQKLEDIEKQPRMNLQQEGEYVAVSYNDKTYYRLQGDVTFSWYIKKSVSAIHPAPTLVMVYDAETERLLEGIYYNHIQVKKEKQEFKTLWRRIYDAKWTGSACDEICEIVEQWLYDNSTTVEEDHYTVTLKLKKGMLREIK